MKYLFLLILSLGPLSAAEIVGSDIIRESLKDIEKIKGAPQLNMTGTMPGRRALTEGRADLGIIFLKDTEQDPRPPADVVYNRYLFANAVAILVVHKENQINQINLEGIKNIFAKNARDSAINWNDLPGGARSEIISPIYYSPVNSFIKELLVGFLLNGDELKINVKAGLDLITVEENIDARFGAAVILPQGLIKNGRIMSIADGRPGHPTVAYTPEEMNIYNGDYPLRIPLYIYVRKDREKELSKTLIWLFSDEVARNIQKQGLTPAPKSIRERLSQRLDR